MSTVSELSQWSYPDAAKPESRISVAISDLCATQERMGNLSSCHWTLKVLLDLCIAEPFAFDYYLIGPGSILWLLD